VAVKESGDAQTGEGSAEAGGYKQELLRTLGSFQVFAVSFAFISVAVGIFGTSPGSDRFWSCATRRFKRGRRGAACRQLV
jgi:hypothetical protein